MHRPSFWHTNTLTGRWIARLLSPLAWLYVLAGFFRRQFTQPMRFSVPIICVGNVTVGGAGKTPTTDYIANILRHAGFRPAILSRGYGGAEAGPVKVDLSRHTAHDVGDEPAMLAQRHHVYIGADRRKTAAMAIADGHDILIKDDGLQNPTLHHDLNILVIDGPRGFGNQHLFPAGPLREPIATALKRCDLVLIIGRPHDDLHDLTDLCHQRQISVISAALHPNDPQPKKVFAFCAIAYPEKFYESLKSSGYEIEAHMSFPDHHMFSETEAAKLIIAAQGRHLITTEKDAARLIGQSGARGKLLCLSETLPIRLSPEPSFDTEILDRINQLS